MGLQLHHYDINHKFDVSKILRSPTCASAVQKTQKRTEMLPECTIATEPPTTRVVKSQAALSVLHSHLLSLIGCAQTAHCAGHLW